MKAFKRLFMSLGLVAALATVSSAQYVSGATYLTFPQRCTFLVANPFSLKKLQLTATQSQQVQKIQKNYAASQNKILAEKEPSSKEMQANDTQFAASCLKLLTPAQLETLIKLGVHEVGTSALADSGVCSRIGLGTAQYKKIRDIHEGYAKHEEDVAAMIGSAIEAIPEPKPGKDRTAYEAKCNEINNSYEGERQRLKQEKAQGDARILAIMTSDQRAKWLALVGSGRR